MKENSNQPQFNGTSEQNGMNEAFEQDQASRQNEPLRPSTSLGNNERNDGSVNGSTFGSQSNPAKFSSLGQNKGGTSGAQPENPDRLGRTAPTNDTNAPHTGG